MANPVKYHLGKFPPKDLNWEKLIPLIGPASAALARYDGMLAAIPNPTILLTPLFTQEAVLSSRIEGTQATMGEVLEYEAGVDSEHFSKERKADIHEILNYRRAVNAAEKMLETLPLCQRVLKEAHSKLMEGVRGQGKSPGEYRKVPNWIGPPGCTIDEAKFVPIDAANLPDAMGRWEIFIHDSTPDRLVQLALIHAEFEALHPFLDGNGRLGRMFVPLFLYGAKVLHRPMFYISAYLEAKRDEYYERLLSVSRDGDWTGWCQFFLEAITIQAEDNTKKTKAILALYERKKTIIAEATHSQYAIKALDFLFSRPIFQTSAFASESGIPVPTAKRILRVLQGLDFFIILQEASGRRPAVVAFKKLLNAAEGQEIF